MRVLGVVIATAATLAVIKFRYCFSHLFNRDTGEKENNIAVFEGQLEKNSLLLRRLRRLELKHASMYDQIDDMIEKIKLIHLKAPSCDDSELRTYTLDILDNN